MSEEDKESFLLSNKFSICDKLFDAGDNKVRDHCYVTGKGRGSVRWSIILILGWLKKVPVIFHNLRNYDSHSIMQEIGKFDVKVNLMPNHLEKYMTFTINNNLVIIGNMQFMNSGLDALVKNLSKVDVKYLLLI